MVLRALPLWPFVTRVLCPLPTRPSHVLGNRQVSVTVALRSWGQRSSGWELALRVCLLELCSLQLWPQADPTKHPSLLPSKPWGLLSSQSSAEPHAPYLLGAAPRGGNHPVGAGIYSLDSSQPETDSSSGQLSWLLDGLRLCLCPCSCPSLCSFLPI